MFRSYVLPFGLIVLLLAGWEYSKPRYPRNVEPHTVEHHGPPPPRNANEEIFQDHRRSLRTQTLKQLERPWASYCEPEGRKQLASSIREYFFHRGGQEKSYPARWGDEGRAYITREWSTTDDKRIEGLIADHIRRGYLDPKALDSFTAARVATMTKGSTATAQPCKG